MYKNIVCSKRDNKQVVLLLIMLLIMTSTNMFGGNIYINPGELAEFKIQWAPNNSTIILKPGYYQDIDVSWNWKSNITLKAQTPGTVHFTGDTRIKVDNSSGILIQDIIFIDIVWNYPTETSMGLKFYNSSNIEIYNCAFISNGADTTNGNGIIYIKDRCNDISIFNCYFEDIRSKAIQVWLPNNSSNPNKNIYIYNNYFKDITEGFNYVKEAGWTGNKVMMLGSGYVTISQSNMNAIIEHNLFENCIGDGEIISNKANGNVFEGNTFINNTTPLFQPTLSLRHGDGSVVKNNVFINTAVGLTIHGDNHKIYNNYIEDADIGIKIPGFKAAYNKDGSRNIYGDHPNSAECYIVNNTIVNSKEYGMYFGSNGYTIPETNFIYNNLLHYDPVVCTSAIKYFYGVSGACSNQIWQKNFVTTEIHDCSGSYYASGITYVREYHIDMNTNSTDDLYRLSSTSNARNQAYASGISFLDRDLDYELRGSVKDIGADEYSSQNHNIVLTPNDVGVTYRNNLPKKSSIIQKNVILNQFILSQNYPNPFNPTTQISYQIAKDGFVSLVVYNTLGQVVSTLVNEHQTSGKYSVQFNANSLPSGVYFYKLQSGNFAETKKLILLR